MRYALAAAREVRWTPSRIAFAVAHPRRTYRHLRSRMEPFPT